MSLDWQGDKLIKKMDASIARGINQTMSAAVIYAKKNHTFKNRTGTLEGSIRPVIAAHKEGSEFVGLWGSVDVAYALPVEFRLPFLRPAADAEYPNLAGRIEKYFSGGAS